VYDYTVCTVVERTLLPSPADPKRFDGIKFTLHIRRLPLYYILNLIIPCSLLSFLTLVTFLLPPGVPQRSTNGTCVCVCFMGDRPLFRTLLFRRFQI